uniref:Uncharacterized protein n=1 Tax=Myotis myotis TaxID=51298 RepID=A0A7J7VYH9_MYOMY|nr:hypothetical protein mMyoMyo1_012202 [Myotis myotis]
MRPAASTPLATRKVTAVTPSGRKQSERKPSPLLPPSRVKSTRGYFQLEPGAGSWALSGKSSASGCWRGKWRCPKGGGSPANVSVWTAPLVALWPLNPQITRSLDHPASLVGAGAAPGTPWWQFDRMWPLVA